MKHIEQDQYPISDMFTDDYVRGVVEGEGCFTFCTAPGNKLTGKVKIPTFSIAMHERDLELIEGIREKLALKNRVYIYRLDPLVTEYKTYKRGKKAFLIVRELGSLKNSIIPFFYKKLVGYKGKQFIEWLEKIGSDPFVKDDYKILFRLYKSGYWD